MIDSRTANTMIIQGGTPLHGCVRLGGAKNASYKLMTAALLADSESRLLNLPGIADVLMVKEIINQLGGKAYSAGEKTIFIKPQNLTSFKIKSEYGDVSRASTLFIPALLARFGRAEVPLPGGDKIGKRPLDRHFAGLAKLGVSWQVQDQKILMKAEQLKGTNYRFSKNTHTGTETLIMVAVLAQGKTILENAAQEPEVDDLIKFLNNMGARIRRRAMRVIEIEGVKKLHGAIHKVMPDRNEAVSYACAAIASKGDIIVENARQQDLEAFLAKLQEAGAGIEVADYGIRFFYQGPLRATDVTTEIHPGFMTDWQPLWATLICHAQGASLIHETVMQNRFQYVADLKKMGAAIEPTTVPVADPEKTYNFNWQDRQPSDVHAIRIKGPTQFQGGEFTIHDLRAGATVMLAAISGQGETILHNVEQIDRGYEKIDQKLQSMGAQIRRS
ncbi:MAG: UDP-N-acetylglucosamine 1-carboxyvinyltransferase [Candidatus Pacebacteria bacterium]|nr:UDP-N-acetylglucosamine 1-carboxyvinyltransferase [Candidatus Paceibacterota bacterium]